MPQAAILFWLGVLLVVSGILLGAARVIWPDRFEHSQKTFHAFGIGVSSTWPSFGALALGVILILATLVFR